MLKGKIGWYKEKSVIEFIVIVESGADARTATKLAERVLKEKFDWLDDDILQHCFQWTG